jgi:hypothetical protein
MSEPAASRPPSRRAEVVYTLIVLVVFAVGAYVFWYRATYNILPGQALRPARRALTGSLRS